MRGYTQDGEPVAPFTDFAGLYQRFDEKGPRPPFQLSQRWIAAEPRLDLDTPFNFVSTNDIIGGNSGSPVVNADGEFVGVIFDGNRYSFVWDTIYPGAEGRGVTVDARAIVASLRDVYGATDLVEEMTRR